MARFVINSTGKGKYFLRELYSRFFFADSEIGNRDIIFFYSRRGFYMKGSDSAFTSWKLRFDLFILGQRASFIQKESYEVWTRYISWYIAAYIYVHIHINLCRNYFWNRADEGAKKYSLSNISNASTFKLKTNSASASALLISHPNKIPWHKIFRVVGFWRIYFLRARVEFAVDCRFDSTVFHSVSFLRHCIGNLFFHLKNSLLIK